MRHPLVPYLCQLGLLLGHLAITTPITLAQSQGAVLNPSHHDATPGTYEKVLDILFPRDSSGEYFLVLRYLPAFQMESQVTISRNVQGSYDVDYYFLSAGSKGIGEQIQLMLQKDFSNSPQELASRIRVEHKAVTVPPSLISRVMSDYFAVRIPPKLDTKIVVDGTRYQFWFVALSAENVLHVSVDDRNYGDQVKNPLVAWMNRVKHLVETAASEKK